jgi:CheY-like chemotaxis protein
MSAGAEAMTTLRALVVDDSAAIRHLVRVTLEGMHLLEIDEAADGSEAVRLLAAAPYDVVMLDLNMPIVDGWKVLGWLQGRPAPLPKVIVISTSSDEDTVHRATLLGAITVLAKPLQLHGVRQAVRSALGMSEPPPEDESKKHE